MNIIIKITLSILVFLCLADMPYGYYQFVRFASFIAFGYLAYHAKEEKLINESIICIILALLFQPFLKISLGRELWNVVDVFVGIGLIVCIFKISKTNH